MAQPTGTSAERYLQDRGWTFHNGVWMDAANSATRIEDAVAIQASHDRFDEPAKGLLGGSSPGRSGRLATHRRLQKP